MLLQIIEPNARSKIYIFWTNIAEISPTNQSPENQMR